MENISLSNCHIHKFHAKSKLVSEVLNEVKTLNYTTDTYATNYLKEGHYYNKKLFDWVHLCLEEVRSLYYKDGIELVITGCWANKANKMQSHHKHYHTNSIVSGILYLTSHSNSETVFYNTNPWFHTSAQGILHLSKQPEPFPEVETKIAPISGTLLLFPSNIRHSVNINKSSDTRYTLAFNTFVKGNLCVEGASTELIINPTTVELFSNPTGIDHLRNESKGPIRRN